MFIVFSVSSAICTVLHTTVLPAPKSVTPVSHHPQLLPTLIDKNALTKQHPNKISSHPVHYFPLQESRDVLHYYQHVLANPVEHHHIEWDSK